jgi:hypothetical protein
MRQPGNDFDRIDALAPVSAVRTARGNGRHNAAKSRGQFRELYAAEREKSQGRR